MHADKWVKSFFHQKGSMAGIDRSVLENYVASWDGTPELSREEKAIVIAAVDVVSFEKDNLPPNEANLLAKNYLETNKAAFEKFGEYWIDLTAADLRAKAADLYFPIRGHQALKDANLTGLDGTSQTAWNYLNVAANEYTVVPIWGTWCPICVQEIPFLNDLQKRIQDEHLNVKIVSIASDQLQAFEEPGFLSGCKSSPWSRIQEKPEYPFLLDTQDKVDKAFGIYFLPQVWVLDREGNKVGELHLNEEGKPIPQSVLDAFPNSNPFFDQLNDMIKKDKERKHTPG